MAHVRFLVVFGYCRARQKVQMTEDCDRLRWWCEIKGHQKPSRFECCLCFQWICLLDLCLNFLNWLMIQKTKKHIYIYVYIYIYTDTHGNFFRNSATCIYLEIQAMILLCPFSSPGCRQSVGSCLLAKICSTRDVSGRWILRAFLCCCHPKGLYPS